MVLNVALAVCCDDVPIRRDPNPCIGIRPNNRVLDLVYGLPVKPRLINWHRPSRSIARSRTPGPVAGSFVVFIGPWLAVDPRRASRGLLDDVCELVRQQPPPGASARRVPTGCKRDVGPDRECVGRQLPRVRRGCGVGMQTHAREIRTEPRLRSMPDRPGPMDVRRRNACGPAGPAAASTRASRRSASPCRRCGRLPAPRDRRGRGHGTTRAARLRTSRPTGQAASWRECPADRP